MREGAVRVRREVVLSGVACALVALVTASGCGTAAPESGLLVTFDVTGVSPDTLDLAVRSPNGETVYFDRRYTTPLTWPATLAIVAPRTGESAVVAALIASGGRTLDGRWITIEGVPTDHVAEMEVRFDGTCPYGSDDPLLGPVLTTTACVGACPASCAETVTGAALGDGGSDAGVVSTDAAEERAINDAAPASYVDADATADAQANPDAQADADAGAPPACEAGATECNSAGSVPLSCGVNGQWAANTPCIEGVSHCSEGACATVPNSCLGAGAGAGFNCGGAGGTTDCCASYLVPGGTFYRDYDGVDYDSESYPATISPVLVDAFEVTVGRFRNFVSAVVGGWTPVPGSGKHSNLNDGDGLVLPSGVGAEYEPGWLLSWTANLPATSAGWNAHLASCDGDAGAYYATWTLGDDTLPINCLDWYDAYAFCIWDGGFLPSTAEWNFTASGGDAQRLFAWGENPPGANTIYANWNCYEHGVTGACDARWTAPVGSSPEGNGRWGQSDLTGNLYEFVLDFWSEYPPNPCSDCADTTDGPRMIRGGSFSNSIESLYVANTSYYTPETATLINVGFRCARSP